MIACTPNSDSCISSAGDGRIELPPANATKSPIMLISGFIALAAEPPAPPRLTGVEATATLSAGAGAGLAVSVDVAAGVAACAWPACALALASVLRARPGDLPGHGLFVRVRPYPDRQRQRFPAERRQVP